MSNLKKNKNKRTSAQLVHFGLTCASNRCLCEPFDTASEQNGPDQGRGLDDFEKLYMVSV